MEIFISVAALVVGVVAAIIAIWQANISKEQLKLAKDTEDRTERALEEIRRVTGETRQISQDVKNNVESQISKVIDSKLDAERNTQAQGAEFMKLLMQNVQKPGGPQ
ncbi:hypothetical protein KV395_04305 [Microbacterium luteolum]|uniref:Uncharacterized protein n=1 Tax=Microbacterium luteolum TaxID=69367 RepID=A0ABY7XKC2_MICLT|nr:hypothetical protein [Microbacterium luteolum]WDM42538.1 hypothetical protein KV395_04305 [Microbacterium luteolum]